MRLIQIFDENGEQLMLLNVVRDSLTDEQVEKIIREAATIGDDDEAELFLEQNGIERVFVTEIYL